MIVIIIAVLVLVLLFGGGPVYNRWGAPGGLGLIGTLLVVFLLLYLLGLVH